MFVPSTETNVLEAGYWVRVSVAVVTAVLAWLTNAHCDCALTVVNPEFGKGGAAQPGPRYIFDLDWQEHKDSFVLRSREDVLPPNECCST